MTAYSQNYQKVTLPKAIALVEQDNYVALRALAQDGNTQAVNKFLSYTKQYKARSDAQLNEMAADSIKQANRFTIAAFVLSSFLLLLFTLMIWRILKVLIDPIVKLEEATISLAEGRSVLLSKLQRQDEIGLLMKHS